MTTNIVQPNLRDNIKHVKAIADGVVHVSRAIKQMEEGALNEKAILVLLAHSTGLSQKSIKDVLKGLSQLEEMYVKPKEEK